MYFITRGWIIFGYVQSWLLWTDILLRVSNIQQFLYIVIFKWIFIVFIALSYFDLLVCTSCTLSTTPHKQCNIHPYMTTISTSLNFGGKLSFFCYKWGVKCNPIFKNTQHNILHSPLWETSKKHYFKYIFTLEDDLNLDLI